MQSHFDGPFEFGRARESYFTGYRLIGECSEMLGLFADRRFETEDGVFSYC